MPTPNVIKYSTATQSGTLRIGNFHLGISDIEWGPTETTGFYSGITPPTGGYTIYLNKAQDGPSIYTATDDDQLIGLVNSVFGTNSTTISDTISFLNSTSDTIIINKDYEPIVTDGILLNLDPSFVSSYPRGGTKFFNIANASNNSTLTNGPSYSNINGGAIIFDGSNDTIVIDQEIVTQNWTIGYWQSVDIGENDISIPSLFSNIAQAGAASEGSFSIGSTRFHGISWVKNISDGIIIGGQFAGYDNTIRDTILKLNSDGSLNTNFNKGLNNNGVWSVVKIDQLQNGTLVSATTNLGTGTGIMANNPTTGSVINTFTTSGSRICASFILKESTDSLYILDSWATTYDNQSVNGKIFKISITTGSIDTNFDSTTGFKSAVGKITTDVQEGVNDGIVLSDGNLLCIGSFMEYKGVPATRVVKINASTSALDTSFNYGTGFNARTIRAIQMNNGTIVIVGDFTTYNGTSRNRIIGLNMDGSVNTEFNIGSGFNGNPASMIYDPTNDKIYCFGNFSLYNGTSANRIVKLNSDGSIDTSFNYGTGFNQITSHGDLDSSGKLVVVGTDITSYNGQSIQRGVCRLNVDGTLDNTFSNTNGFNIFRFRQETFPRLSNSTGPFTSGFFNISANREIVNQTNGMMTFNGLKYYTITFDTDNTFRNYINGSLVRTAAMASTMSLRSKTLSFWGQVFGLHIYNRSLTAQEVLQNWNAQKSRFGL